MNADTPESDPTGRRAVEPGAPTPAHPGTPHDGPEDRWYPGPPAHGSGGASEGADRPQPVSYPAVLAYGAGQPVEPDLPRRRAVRLAVTAALALTVLGVPLGLLWSDLAPDTPVVRTADGASYAQSQPEQPVAADGWFSLLGLGFGVLAAVAVWFLLRRLRGPVGLLATVLGAVGAAPVAWQVGRRIGVASYQRMLDTAPEGLVFSKPADLRAGGIEWVFGVFPVPHGNLLLPAFGAAVTYTLLAGWSRWPSLRPERAPDPAGVSWGSAATPVPSAAPEPPGPDAGAPPRG